MREPDKWTDGYLTVPCCWGTTIYPGTDRCTCGSLPLADRLLQLEKRFEALFPNSSGPSPHLIDFDR